MDPPRLDDLSARGGEPDGAGGEGHLPDEDERHQEHQAPCPPALVDVPRALGSKGRQACREERARVQAPVQHHEESERVRYEAAYPRVADDGIREEHWRRAPCEKERSEALAG